MDTDRKLKRLDKKKKKLEALVNIATLNCNDSGECSVPKKPKTDDEHDYYRDLKTQQKHIVSKRKKPTLVLKTAGDQASLSTFVEDRVPILFTDLQHLLLNAILGHKSPYLPLRWCHLEKCGRVSRSVVVIVEGVSSYDYCTHKSHLKFDDRFPHRLEVVTPSLYNGSTVDELAAIPLTDSEKTSLIAEHGSVDAAMEARKDLMAMMRAVFPVTDGPKPRLPSDEIEDKFSRTQLVLSAWQLLEQNYPLPLKGKLQSSYSDYVRTKDVYEPVTVSSPLFGIDCEMCRTKIGLELTRITVVNENYQVVYESYVLPHNEIVDYLTAYSGITEKTLRDVKTRLEDVQRTLRELLPPDAILAGQSLNFDLHAMKMMHPYIVDTSVIFNTSGDRTRKTKLKNLAKQFLKKDIQAGDKGHCSREDALTSLKLVKLKLSKSLSYGDAILKGKQRSEETDHLKKSEKECASNIFNRVVPENKSCFILGSENVIEKYSKYLKRFNDSENKNRIKFNKFNDNSSVITNICEKSNDFALTIGHISINVVNPQSPNIYLMLSEQIENIWNVVESNCLVVIVLAGSKEYNGVAFINVKK